MGTIVNSAVSIIKGINIDAQHQYLNPNQYLNSNGIVVFPTIVGGIIIGT